MRLPIVLPLLIWWTSSIESEDVPCLPSFEAIGLQNSQGIPPINCQMESNQKIINCYPKQKTVFPTAQRISCTPAEVDPFVCSPVSAADGPSNFYGIPPIKCQKIIDNSVVECYPNRRITFPAQGPVDRILCFPIPPDPVGPEPTTLLPTSTEFSKDPVTCRPLDSYYGGVENGEGVYPITCRLKDNYSVINCYPPFQIFFPQENPVDEVSCTPMPPFPIICDAQAEIPGAAMNSDGIFPIQCMTFYNETVRCFPDYLVTFPKDLSTNVVCLSEYVG